MPDQTYSPEESKRMLERGLYTGSKEDSFKSEKRIKREAALRGDLPVFETPLPGARGFPYWSDRMKTRQAQWKETSQIESRHIKVAFSNDTIINLIGDSHVGSPNTHYDRLDQEVKTILETPFSYVILVGDLVDGFFFTPAVFEQIEPAQEQWAYVDSLLKLLATHKRLIMGFNGDHDGWAKKMGVDPYYKFAEELGAYYMHGVGHITLKTGDHEHRLVGAHRLPGFSMYNNVHPQVRASREVQGADIYFSGHTHVKGYALQGVKEFGGTARKAHFISIGPYKSDDEYSRKIGWAQLSPQEMFGCALKLGRDGKIEYFDDILEANQ